MKIAEPLGETLITRSVSMGRMSMPFPFERKELRGEPYGLRLGGESLCMGNRGNLILSSVHDEQWRVMAVDLGFPSVQPT